MSISNVTAISAEGARVGFVACEMCGAAILLDPRDERDRPLQHMEWHQAHGEDEL